MSFDGHEFPEDFYGSLAEIRRFVHMQSHSISFHPDCAGPDDSDRHMEVEADTEFRFTIMQRILSVLGELATSDVGLQSLSINCLQGYIDPRIIEKPVFRLLLQRLRSLSLYVVREQYNAEPERSIYYPEIHTFYKHFPDIWLRPASKSLTTLSLYGDDFWGWCPKVDFRHLHFPNLRILALGNFTFSHDWQVEWISDHGQTLEELYLDDCPILTAEFTKFAMDEEGYPIVKESDYRSLDVDDVLVATTHHRRWRRFYEIWSRALQKLLIFKIGSGGWDDVLANKPFLEYRSMEKVRRHYHFYAEFDVRISPAQWRLHDLPGFCTVCLPQTSDDRCKDLNWMRELDADDTALADFWRTIDLRRGDEVRSIQWRYRKPDCFRCLMRDQASQYWTVDPRYPEVTKK